MSENIPQDRATERESLLNPGDVHLRDIKDFLTIEKYVVLNGGDAATATNYGVFYIANQPCFIIQAKLRHGQDSTSGVIDIEKVTSGIAAGSGTSVLVGTFDISASANTVQTRSAIVSSLKTTNLNIGDSLAVKALGTLTGASNVIIGVLLGYEMKDVPTGPNL